IGASMFLAHQNPDSEKVSPYECGFEAFGDARRQFDVRFYLVAILFIIFDLEVAFLFPWAITLGQIGVLGFWSMVVFLGILTVGFIYEWRKGALEWEEILSSPPPAANPCRRVSISTRFCAESTRSCPTKASWSPAWTGWSTGHAPVRCGR